jgi:hypothetical protein
MSILRIELLLLFLGNPHEENRWCCDAFRKNLQARETVAEIWRHCGTATSERFNNGSEMALVNLNANVMADEL